MKKVGTITFHRAQNYGSILQTYALQNFVCTLGQKSGAQIDYKVIDVIPNAQDKLYSIFKKGLSAKNLIKNTVAFFNYGKLKRKQKAFANFLDNHISLTDFCKDEKALSRVAKDIDYCISGSDQIWNVRSSDFEDYYYLNFVKTAKKVSYAASFGPLEIDWTKYDADKYSNLLKEYSSISTREIGSAKNVEILMERQAEIHVDPTLLLDREDWRSIQSNANYHNGKYILLYCLEPTKQQLLLAKKISKKLRLPIVVTKYNNKNDIINNFVKKYDTGPSEFLSLVDNASLVITSSFHGTAFSLIYRKKFYVLNGKTDNRISDILEKTELLERSLESLADIEKVNLQDVDFLKTEEFLQEQKRLSEIYLKDALDL